MHPWDKTGSILGTPIVRQETVRKDYAHYSDETIDYMYCWHVYRKEELESHRGNLEFFFETEADLAELRNLATRITRVEKNAAREEEEVAELERERFRRQLLRQIGKEGEKDKPPA